jgi:hypothetical protein
MAIEVSPTVKAIGPKPFGEILWLAVTLIAFAVIMGIVCWPLSAELLPRRATGAVAGSRSIRVVAATSASTAAAPSPIYSVNRLPLPEASLPSMDLAVDSSSGGGLATALGAQAGASAVQPSPGDPGGPAPAARRPQQARSDSAARKKAASPSRPAPTLTPPAVKYSGW